MCCRFHCLKLCWDYWNKRSCWLLRSLTRQLESGGWNRAGKQFDASVIFLHLESGQENPPSFFGICIITLATFNPWSFRPFSPNVNVVNMWREILWHLVKSQSQGSASIDTCVNTLWSCVPAYWLNYVHNNVFEQKKTTVYQLLKPMMWLSTYFCPFRPHFRATCIWFWCFVPLACPAPPPVPPPAPTWAFASAKMTSSWRCL